jgi:hypothetical protein
MWCALFGDQGVVPQVQMTVVPAVIARSQPPNFTFTLENDNERAASQGQYQVLRRGLDLSIPHRLWLSFNGNKLAEVAFTTTPQTIAHGAEAIASGVTAYWTKTSFTSGSCLADVTRCSISRVSDNSYLLTVGFEVNIAENGNVSTHAFERTFHLVSGI